MARPTKHVFDDVLRQRVIDLYLSSGLGSGSVARQLKIKSQWVDTILLEKGIRRTPKEAGIAKRRATYEKNKG